ncbi:hypothetical protein N788_05490 [Arenimonas donghaensis DSM 18148 = HO3-R19]|uniref:Sensory/regulatory protein RpfC n=1 Tax=Arenimonas donghaensis DSM 18148 = HO3-R19 TaxID=1121014 RepID=A0A087MGJ4_9GAMM|nr:hypothetical protein N788_05490 [Arenimonas donghaensis DSM 18148 = HO3-R19]
MSLAVVLLSAGLSAGTYYYVGEYNQQRAQEEFDRVATSAAEDVRLRVSSYEFGARGARGAIVAAGVDAPSRARFITYMNTRDLPTEFPGALGFGYIRRVSRGGLASFLDEARDDGFPGFSLRELNAHAGDHYIIQYIEPSGANYEAIGLDIGSEANRRLAADRAMLSGKATLTEPITLVQATGKPARGFLLLLPVYDPSQPQSTPEQRRTALVGWSYAPLVVDDVLRHIGATLDDFTLSIRDPDSDDVTLPFYRSERETNEDAPSARRRLSLFGRQWDLEFTASRAFSESLGLVSPGLPAGLLLAIGILTALSARYYLSTARMRQHLQADRARTAALFNQSQDAILDLDLDMRLINANKAAAALLGDRLDVAEDRSAIDALAIVEGEVALRRALESVAKGMPRATTELSLRGNGRDDSHSVAIVSAVRGADGKTSSLSITLRDVSRQRAMEATLSEISVLTSAQLGEDFMDAAANALGRLLRADLVTIDRIAPDSPDQAIVLAAYREGLDVSRWRYELEAAINSQAEPTLGMAVPTGDRQRGSRVRVDAAGGLPTPLPGLTAASCISLPLFDTQDRVFGHLSVFHGRRIMPADFDRAFEVARLFSHRVEAEMRRMLAEQERLTAESRLRDLNESLERQAAERTRQLRHTLILQEKIVEGAGVALIATDQEGVITLFNPAAESLLGRRAADLVGKSTPAVFHDPAEVEQRAQEISRALGRPFPPGFEVFVHGVDQDTSTSRDWTYLHVSGTRIPVLLGISQLQDDDGTVLGYLGVAVDMRAQREQAEALRRAVERSESATRAKSEFLANVSHEIRTPMNAILGMMQLLATTSLDSRQQEFVRKSEGAAHSLLAILNDVLDFSKIEAGMMSTENQPFSLQMLLSELSIICEGLGAKPGVEIAFDVDARLPDRFVGDALRIKQVLTNLLGNAIKFTDAGHIILSIKPVSAEADCWTMEFSVKDTGIGIPENLQAHIFSSFAQAEASTARRYGGTGLGLSICDRLVSMMGGRMNLRSVPGHGSTFFFSLALPQLPGEQADGSAPRSSQSVLVVEPNEVARDILQGLCRQLGCQVQATCDRAQARRLLAGQPVDVLLLAWSEYDEQPLDELVNLALELNGNIHHGVLFAASGSRHRLLLEVSTKGLQRVRYLSKPALLSSLATGLSSLQSGESGERPQDQATVASSALAGVRVLVVDDNPMNRDVARDVLEAEGAEVRLCTSGQEALDRLDEAPDWPVLLLTDIQMPGLDGYALSRRVRQDPRFASLAILALTAHVTDSDRAACLAAGMSGHVGKPINVAELRSQILRCLGQGGGAIAPEHADRQKPTGLAAAKRRFQQHPSAFQGALRSFLENAPVLVAELLNASSSTEDRRRAAHTLKGNAATAGCDGLADLAARAEERLRTADGLDPAGEQALQAGLSQALQDVRDHLAHSPGQPPQTPPASGGIQAGEVQAKLQVLHGLLVECNFRAVVEAEDLIARWPGVAPALATELLTRTRDFDFEGALQRCEVLLTTLGSDGQ